MTDEEKEAHVRKWLDAVGTAVTGIMPTNKVGLVVARVFIGVRHEDGTMSAGNIGITPEDEQHTQQELTANLLHLILDGDQNREVRAVEVKKQ